MEPPTTPWPALARHLLVERAGTSFSFAPSCTELSYFPEWEQPLGTPTQTVSSIRSLQVLVHQVQVLVHQVYARSFTNGIVMVNPKNTTSRPITLAQPYLEVVPTGGVVPSLGGDGQVELVPVMQIQLAPHTGVMLLAKAE
jgi:hypothetical protein